MKTCKIYGRLGSDRTDEQYPTVNLCDECVSGEQSLGENSKIINIDEYDSAYGETCEFCQITVEEELEGLE